ncbi:MAG: hypothetical protein E7255_03720 [Lachnospiraceae bacterium]|jgi:hypothetical protein|nr:hypothetical protein [Lachnospiraceae bacterium]
MKTKYPMEAFALAMVVFSFNMREAFLTGILLLLITVFGLVIDQVVGRQLPSWSRRISMTILILAITYSLFQVVIVRVLQENPDYRTVFLQLVAGAFIAWHVLTCKEADYNNLLFEGSFAYGALILIGLLREFLSYGTIFEYKIADYAAFTPGFQNAIVGFMLSAAAIAIINRAFVYEEAGVESLWVILPAMIVYQPFSLDLPVKSLGILISIVVAVLLFLSVRKYLTFSNISREWRRLPIDLLSVGMIYLILMVF